MPFGTFRSSAQAGLSFTWLVSILQTIVFAPWILWVIWTERAALGPTEWFFIAGSAGIHIAYYYFLQRGYRSGDISLVYPIARGSGPMLSSLAAIIFLGERADFSHGSNLADRSHHHDPARQ
jgi:multidrug transporter EmrE-like cation transporter